MKAIEEEKNIVLIKIGGSTLKSESESALIVKEVTKLVKHGITPILVHGGGPHINARLQALGVEPQFKNGLRVTDATTLDVVIDELNNVNQKLRSLFAENGIETVAINEANKIFNCKQQKNGELGFVGEITSVNLDNFVFGDATVVPVVAPSGIDEFGQKYNINADHAAMALAAALNVKTLVYLSDVPGLMKDMTDPESLVKELAPEEAKAIIDSGELKGGMIEKLANSIEALMRGVEQVCIADGRVDGILLKAALREFFVGTTIKARA